MTQRLRLRARRRRASRSLHAVDAVEGASYVTIDVTNWVSFAAHAARAGRVVSSRFFARTNRVVAHDQRFLPGRRRLAELRAALLPDRHRDERRLVRDHDEHVLGAGQPPADRSRCQVIASGADVDAFEIVPSGTFKALAACIPPVDSACGPHEFCAAGWCRDGNAFVPPLPPPTSAGRCSSTSRTASSSSSAVASRARTTCRARSRRSTALYDRARPWTFWNGIITAIHRLHDWHTTVNGPVSSVGGRGAFPICFVEGDADLSARDRRRRTRTTTTCSSRTSGRRRTAALKPGDRLVAINGMHPIAFVESLDALDWGMWRADDPDTHAEADRALSSVIRRWATNITSSAATRSRRACGAPQTIADDVDLPSTTATYSYPYCDHRPLYHLERKRHRIPSRTTRGAARSTASLTRARPARTSTSMIWNDVYLDRSSANPYQPATTRSRATRATSSSITASATAASCMGAEYLTSICPPSGDDRSRCGLRPDRRRVRLRSRRVRRAQPLQRLSLPIGAYNVGSTTARKTKLPTALLIARDGSASDWFPLGMRGGSPNIRVFGRHTAGAFSSYFVYDYYGGLSWRLASGDLDHARRHDAPRHGRPARRRNRPRSSRICSPASTPSTSARSTGCAPAPRAANEEARAPPLSCASGAARATCSRPIPPVVPDAGCPRPPCPTRTVGHRSPFGDVFQADNLMVDGDFELTGRNDQAPWIVFDELGQQTLNYETGGHCRSGVRCAIIAPGERLVGYMASPAQERGRRDPRVRRSPTRALRRRAGRRDRSRHEPARRRRDRVDVVSQPDETGWCFFMGSGDQPRLPAADALRRDPVDEKSKSIIVDQVSVLPGRRGPRAQGPRASTGRRPRHRAGLRTEVRAHMRRRPSVPAHDSSQASVAP